MKLWNVSFILDSESSYLHSNNENFLDEAIASGYLMLEDNAAINVKETLYASGKNSCINKKVLLRERKWHTAHCAASVRCADLSWLGGGGT